MTIKTNEDIKKWRDEYTSSLQGWHEEVNKVQLHFADIIKKSWQKTKYIVRNLPYDPDKMVVCPPHSALNLAPNQQHRTDYATGAWEGSSAEAILDKNNKFVGINVLLHRPRLARMIRSLHARGYKSEVSIEKFSQAILDIVAIHGYDMVTEDDGVTPARAYIRPSMGTGVGPWGISLGDNHFVETSALAFRWGGYFADVDRVNREGVKSVITGVQRMFPILGKHASNYGAAAMDGWVARKLQYDELIYLAPYCINKDGCMDYSMKSFEDIVRYGVLSDGPGEELFGILKDGETLVYPPLRVNRLGGTVLDYVAKHLAPKLGIRVIERDITLEQIRTGEVTGLAFVGNAVKVTSVNQVDIVRPDSDGRGGKKIETLATFGVHPTIAKIRNQFLDEVFGRKEPSHETLLTPVDVEWGSQYKEYLDDYWKKLGF